MKRMKSVSRILVIAVVTTGALGVPVLRSDTAEPSPDRPAAAAPRAVAPQPVAQEILAGASLSFTTPHSWDRAAVRVSGPGGFVQIERFEESGPLSVDLSRAAGKKGLADGAYRYELRLVSRLGKPRERVADGVFYVEGGVPVSRHQARSRLASTRRELLGESTPATLGTAVQDYLIVQDVNADDWTFISLANQASPAGSWSYWALQMYQQDLDLTFRTQPGFPQHKFTLTRDSHFGIGTSAPSSEIHIFPELREYDPTGFYSRRRRPEMYLYTYQKDFGGPVLTRGWEIAATPGQFFVRDKGTGGAGTNRPLLIEANAPEGALRIRANSIQLGSNLSVPRGGISTETLRLASSRASKHEIAPVDAGEVLDKLAGLPVAEWSFKDDPDGVRHLGPMAEDFHAAFALEGQSERHLSVTDVQGVTIAALQGLRAELAAERQARRSEAAGLERENLDLRRRLEALERLLAERQDGGGARPGR